MCLHYWITIVIEVKLITWNFKFILFSGLNSTDDFVSASCFSCASQTSTQLCVRWHLAFFSLFCCPSAKYERTLLVHCRTNLCLHNGVLRLFSPFWQVHFIDNSSKIEMIPCHVTVRLNQRQTFYLWIIWTSATN